MFTVNVFITIICTIHTEVLSGPSSQRPVVRGAQAQRVAAEPVPPGAGREALEGSLQAGRA